MQLAKQLAWSFVLRETSHTYIHSCSLALCTLGRLCSLSSFEFGRLGQPGNPKRLKLLWFLTRQASLTVREELVAV